MVKFDKDTKNLTIPSALGNFRSEGGGGMTPAQVQEMIDSSITEYDVTIQEEFDTTNSGVSVNAENIEALSGKTQEIETALENYATTAQTNEISSGLTELSGATEQLSQTVGEKANASDLTALSGVTEQIVQGIEALSGQTSALTSQIEAVSGAIPTISVEQIISGGTKIGTITVNGEGTDLFVPEGAKTYVLNLMTQEERAALYTELMQYSGSSSSSVSSALPIEDYYFFVWETGSTYFKSFVPVYVAYYSTDYGGSIFFTGLTAGRNNDSEIYKTRFILKYNGTFEKANKKMSVEVDIAGLNYSWTGQLKYDADNSQFLRGSTVLNPSVSHSNFESSTRIDELINKFIAVDSGASNRLLTPDLPFILISGGTEHKYTEPTIDGEDISAVTIDGQTYNRQYSFIYTKEDGSRFVIRMKLNSSQKATGFEYEYVANGGGSSAEQDYLIVPALSAVTETKDGVLAYLSGYSYTAETECIKIAPTSAWDNPEGFLAHIKRISDDDNMSHIYISGNNFYWDWNNDGKWNERNIYDHIIRYKTHNDENPENCYFLLNKADLTAAGYYVVKSEDRQEAEVVIEDYTEYAPAYSPHSFNLYESGWTKATVPQVYVIDKMTQVERVNLYNFIETNYFNAGIYDFSNFLFYFTVKNNETVSIPFNIINHYTGAIVFSNVGSKYDEVNKVEIRRGFLYSDGTYGVEGPNTFGQYSPERLNILQDRDWLCYVNDTFSGYTFDFSNVPNDSVCMDYEQEGWSWLFKVQKGGDGNYYDGDGAELNNDNQYHLKDRDNCYTFYKRTGDTMTVIFTTKVPSSVSDLNINADASYTATTEAISYFFTNDTNDIIPTGNTASDEGKFNWGQQHSYLATEYECEKKVPIYGFRVVTAAGKRHYVNPTPYYDQIPTETLYDKDGNQCEFNEKFYYDYGKYVVSLLAQYNGSRYAKLTVQTN